jgi:hypothetical protein
MGFGARKLLSRESFIWIAGLRWQANYRSLLLCVFLPPSTEGKPSLFDCRSLIFNSEFELVGWLTCLASVRPYFKLHYCQIKKKKKPQMCRIWSLMVNDSKLSYHRVIQGIVNDTITSVLSYRRTNVENAFSTLHEDQCKFASVWKASRTLSIWFSSLSYLAPSNMICRNISLASYRKLVQFITGISG